MRRWSDGTTWSRCCGVMPSTANGRSNREGEIAKLVEAADVLEVKLADSAAATEILELILERDPKNLRALAALAKTYEAREDFVSLPGDAGASFGTGRGPARNERSWNTDGNVPKRSGGIWRRRYSIIVVRSMRTPNTCRRPKPSSRRCDLSDNWPEVAKLVERRLPLCDEAKRKDLLLELAGLYADKLGEPDHALSALPDGARALAPTDAAALQPLAERYFRPGAWAMRSPCIRC